MPMRWRWPPENSCGKRCELVGGRARPGPSARARGASISARAAAAMDAQRLGDQVADAAARIERGVGILEHHLHLVADGPQLRAGRAARCPRPSKRSSPDGDVVEADEAAAERRLAAAGFADQAQRSRRARPAARRRRRRARSCGLPGDRRLPTLKCLLRSIASSSGGAALPVMTRPCCPGGARATRRRAPPATGSRRRRGRRCRPVPDARRISRSGSGSAARRRSPCGRSSSEGGMPGIDCSRCGRGPSSGGIESSRPRV